MMAILANKKNNSKISLGQVELLNQRVICLQDFTQSEFTN